MAGLASIRRRKSESELRTHFRNSLEDLAQSLSDTTLDMAMWGDYMEATSPLPDASTPTFSESTQGRSPVPMWDPPSSPSKEYIDFVNKIENNWNGRTPKSCADFRRVFDTNLEKLGSDLIYMFLISGGPSPANHIPCTRYGKGRSICYFKAEHNISPVIRSRSEDFNEPSRPYFRIIRVFPTKDGFVIELWNGNKLVLEQAFED